jgi:hypothetical protein
VLLTEAEEWGEKGSACLESHDGGTVLFPWPRDWFINLQAILHCLGQPIHRAFALWRKPRPVTKISQIAPHHKRPESLGL